MIIKKIEEENISQAIMTLLLEADPCPTMVWDYLSYGELFVMFDKQRPVCTAVMLDFQDGNCELKNLATDETYRGQGLASTMIEHLCKEFAARGCATMEVGTADVGDDTTIPFYEHRGFHRKGIIKGFFLSYPQPVFDNGKQCIDMVMLERHL